MQDIHCVTRWSRFDTRFEGVHWRELARLCRPRPSARFAIAWAEHDFSANVPLGRARRRARAARDARRRRAAGARPRLPAAPRRAPQLLLEERQVAARHRARAPSTARLLGALRLPQRRRPLARRALRVLSDSKDHPIEGSGEPRRAADRPLDATQPVRIDPEGRPPRRPFSVGAVLGLADAIDSGERALA